MKKFHDVSCKYLKSKSNLIANDYKWSSWSPSIQGEILQLERTRASMAEEIVKMSNMCDSLEEQVKEVPELRKTAKVS